jgi:small subunit ribosomal protein S17
MAGRPILKQRKNNMKKIFNGIIVSVSMKKTAVIKITRMFPHPLYKKLMKRDSNFNADIGTFAPKIGDKVKIAESKPISKTKHFRIVEVTKDGSA